MRFVHILATIALFSLAAFAQAPQPLIGPASKVEDVHLAKDDGRGKAGEVTDIFAPSDIPIHCVVALTDSEPKAVKMLLVAVKVPGVRPESKVVTAAYATREKQNRVYFTGRPEGKWTAGSYRIDIFVEGKLERSVAFEVKGAGIPAAASKFTPPAKPTKRRN